MGIGAASGQEALPCKTLRSPLVPSPEIRGDLFLCSSKHHTSEAGS